MTTTSNHALVIEDDVATADAVRRVVESFGHEVSCAHSIAEARAAVERIVPELVLVDLGMPDGDGVAMVGELRERGVEDFVVISGERSQARVVESLRAGVTDFLLKPVKLSDIHRVVSRVVQARQDRQIGVATPASGPVVEPARLVGSSEATRKLRHAVVRVAGMKPVRAVVTGASGVGKRNIAASIHQESGATGRALYVDCASEVDESAVRRFFGHVSDAVDGRTDDGYVRRAADGTLVLDDLSQLSKELQSALVTFLDAGKVTPANGYEPVKVECAVIGILREPVAEAFSSGRLREDLYYGLAGAIIAVPSLSERREDTLEIAERTIAGLNAASGTDRTLSDELRERLADYEWPGNVVELKNVLRAAHAGTAADEQIGVDKVFVPALSEGGSEPAAHLVGNSFWEVEKKLLLATLEHTEGNKRQAARILGISLKTLYNRLHAYS